MQFVSIEDIEARGEAFEDAVAGLSEDQLKKLPEDQQNILLESSSEDYRRLVLQKLAAAVCFDVVSGRLEDFAEANGYMSQPLGIIRLYVNAVQRGVLPFEHVSLERLKEVYGAYEALEWFLEEKRKNDKLEAARREIWDEIGPERQHLLTLKTEMVLCDPVSVYANEQDRQRIKSFIGEAKKWLKKYQNSISSLQHEINFFKKNFYSHMEFQLPQAQRFELMELYPTGVNDANRDSAIKLVGVLEELKRDEKEALQLVERDLKKKRKALIAMFPHGLDGVKKGSWNHVLFCGDMEEAVRRSLYFHLHHPDGKREISTLLKAAEHIRNQLNGPAAAWMREQDERNRLRIE